MARIDCGSGPVPCRCDPLVGCGHLSSWHYVYIRWLARCAVPGCDCAIMEPCNCTPGSDGELPEPDSRVLADLGIAVS